MVKQQVDKDWPKQRKWLQSVGLLQRMIRFTISPKEGRQNTVSVLLERSYLSPQLHGMDGIQNRTCTQSVQQNT
jgi:hypothetical protein